MALTDNLEAYWKLEEASGSRADSTANARTLTDNASVGQAAGKLGNAAQFVRASAQYLSRTSEAGLQFSNEDMTIAFWVYLDSTGTVHKIVSKGTGGNEYLVQVTSAAKAEFVLPSHTATHGTALSTATWYHICARYDATADLAKIRVSGVGSEVTVGDTTGASSGSNEFRLGRQQTAIYMDGRLDSVGIWRRHLSDSELDSLYNSGSGLEYPFGAAYTSTLTETLTLADALTKGSARLLSESMGVSDNRLDAISRLLTEALTLTDARTLATARALTEALTLADARTSAVARALSETLTLADARTLAAARTLTESVALTDGRAMATTRALAETLGLSDALTAQLVVLLGRVLVATTSGGPATLTTSGGPAGRTTSLA